MGKLEGEVNSGLVKLVGAARVGGTAEIDALITAVWPRAYRTALSILGDYALAEDAAQEACAIVFREIRRLRAPGAFGVWFYRIVVRQAMLIERRNPAAAQSVDVPVLETELAMLRIELLRALTNLSPAQRTCIALHYCAQLNSREIADILDMPDSSVRFHIMRGKRSLKAALTADAMNDGSSQLRKPYGVA